MYLAYIRFLRRKKYKIEEKSSVLLSVDHDYYKSSSLMFLSVLQYTVKSFYVLQYIVKSFKIPQRMESGMKNYIDY